MPTVTRTPGFAFWNSSATASLMGKTVLEPSKVTVRDSAGAAVVPLGWPPPQATETATVTHRERSEQ